MKIKSNEKFISSFAPATFQVTAGHECLAATVLDGAEDFYQCESSDRQCLP